ncbi:alpha/beta hydrolase [Nocardioides marmoribigeumensis]|uniref:Alpha-beta hydrolase superfamily lysophospholipase n=1 Tax=Nocardioides marmoribigeumensis TaxID=433649 RepID=A0ABU2C1I6_9ACTN|nr:alpha/beta hydrolase [Nocardioides marmoribigeumensis]MDR7364449.1 alpha-beta hydrolase superfamily lysophospholipase [Nocardioides marmoribigeumensis]
MSPAARPAWQVDVLGRPYYAETFELPPDDEGPVVATLVRRKASRKRSRRAVLHLHGFCDYFFQTAAADFWTSRGYDFYALDLRKYGRSLREHQTPNFARDLAEYHPEIDLAHQVITERDGHDHVVLSGHSTGGLIGALWAEARSPRLAGLFLNAPWLDMHGSFLLRTAGTRAIDQIGARRPYQEIPRSVSGLYARSLHRDHDGAWDFDLAWKPLASWPVHAGWVRAVRRGHATVHKGLSLTLPTLVMTSTQSVFPKAWEPAVDASDIVLDVAQIARWSTKVSRHLTLVRVEGALHDVTLSRPAVRDEVFDQLGRWLSAYVEPTDPA